MFPSKRGVWDDVLKFHEKTELSMEGLSKLPFKCRFKSYRQSLHSNGINEIAVWDQYIFYGKRLKIIFFKKMWVAMHFVVELEDFF